MVGRGAAFVGSSWSLRPRSVHFFPVAESAGIHPKDHPRSFSPSQPLLSLICHAEGFVKNQTVPNLHNLGETPKKRVVNPT